MNIIDFLKYWLDTHPIIFGFVAIILAGGISSTLSNLFRGKNDWKVDVEHEKHFWK